MRALIGWLQAILFLCELVASNSVELELKTKAWSKSGGKADPKVCMAVLLLQPRVRVVGRRVVHSQIRALRKTAQGSIGNSQQGKH